jgi:hypothetical protein
MAANVGGFITSLLKHAVSVIPRNIPKLKIARHNEWTVLRIFYIKRGEGGGTDKMPQFSLGLYNLTKLNLKVIHTILCLRLLPLMITENRIPFCTQSSGTGIVVVA